MHITPSHRGARWIAALALVAAACGSSSVSSQELAGRRAPAADEEAAADDRQATTVRSADSLGGMIVSGGVLNVVFFGTLGAFSVWAAAVALERLVCLRRNRVLPRGFVSRLRTALQAQPDTAGDLQAICAGSRASAARILHAGLLRAGRSVPEVEKAMEDAAAREMANLRTRNRPLSVVGSIAPLVGLLGTVVGMILAFQTASQEGLGKSERLAEGIYLALMTTAAGLTIAIPCLLLVNWFNTKVERFMCDIDECLMETIPTFARWEASASRALIGGNGNPRSPPIAPQCAAEPAAAAPAGVAD